MSSSPFLQLALALPLLAVSPSAELPVSEWIERSAQLESLVLDFEVTSSYEKMGKLHFAYEAPGRCHVHFKGGSEVQQWIDGGVMTVRADGDDGPMHYRLDLEDLFEASEAWLCTWEERLPRTKPARPRVPGPTFLIWPESEEDSVRFKFEYTTNSPSLFAWLPSLRHSEFEVSELADGAFELRQGTDLRMELEPQYGVPRSAWLGEGEAARHALRLIQMTEEVELSDEFVIPAVADDSVDRSGEMMVQISRAGWSSSRVSAHVWLWNRLDEDEIEISDKDLETIISLFAEHYRHLSSAFFEQRLGLERQRIDALFDRLEEMSSDPNKREAVEAMILDLKLNGTKKYREGLSELTTSFLDQIEGVPVDGADQDHLEGMLELERQGASRFMENHFVERVMQHLAQRIEDLD